MAGMKGRSGGRRPGAGRKRTTPNASEIMRALEEIRQRLGQIERVEHGELILRRLVAIERRLGLVETPAAPRVSRRRPLGEI